MNSWWAIAHAQFAIIIIITKSLTIYYAYALILTPMYIFVLSLDSLGNTEGSHHRQNWLEILKTAEERCHTRSVEATVITPECGTMT